MQSIRPIVWAAAFAFAALWATSASAIDVPRLRDSVQVAAGEAHSCALRNDGAVQCWGGNEFGQLGDDSRNDRPTPVRVQGLPNDIAQIAAGDRHTCAIARSGALYCWGMNFYGQLGDGTTELRLTAIRVPGIDAVQAVSLGENHSCALTSGGGVKCWGANYSGQLGDGTLTDRASAVDVAGLSSGAIAIGVAHRHSCAVLADRTLRCWGFNFFGQLGDGSTTDRTTAVPVANASGIASVALGRHHSCAVATAGTVQCWGANNNGQLGIEADETPQLRPVAVPLLGNDIVALALGAEHSCARLRDGALRCWGRNDLGQVGDTTTVRRNLPVPVTIGVAASSLAVGHFHGCAVLADDSVECWGLHFSGQLGDGRTTRRFLPDSVTRELGTDVQALTAGEEHSCAVTGGIARCWGLNFSGQLGDDTVLQRLTPVAVQQLGGGVSAIAAGGFHTCALRSGGAHCWGRNDFGQLGNGTGNDSKHAVPVTGLGSDVIALAGGGIHTCALLAAGNVKCWGHNFVGQLGDGTTERRFTPVDVQGVSGARAIAAGWFGHTCAITAERGVRCWGANAQGQLGDGTTTDRSTPVAVQGIANVVALALGGTHSCALLADGTMRCWGSNEFGQLGDDSLVQRTTPVAVVGLENTIRAIAAQRNATCAVNGDGVLCWGRNDIGQVGDGTTLQHQTPARVSGLGSDAALLTNGADHGCVLQPALGVTCWGSNYSGQFGDGRFAGIPLPQTVLIDDGRREIAAAAAGDAASSVPSSDITGRYVVFQSDAADLVAGDTNGATDVFRRDREDDSVVRVSVDDREQPLTGAAIEPHASGDGRLVVFVAADAAVAAVHGETAKRADTRRKGGQHAIFMRNLLTGTTQRIGTAAPGGIGSKPQLAGDGSAIVFTALPSAAQGNPAQPNVVRAPLQQVGDTIVVGALDCISCRQRSASGVATDVAADGDSGNAVVSGNGLRIAFETRARNLDGTPTACPASISEIMLFDVATGVLSQVGAVAGLQAVNCGVDGATAPSIDHAGDRIAYQSDQILGPQDIDGHTDVLLYEDARPDLVIRISDNAALDPANGDSIEPALSGNGRQIVYVSAATNLDAADADDNGRPDLHISTIDGTTVRLDDTARGDAADGASARPAVNYDGTALAYESTAKNLLAGLTSGLSNIYQRRNPVAPAVKSASWWNSAESGWGLTVFDQGALLVPAWFTYDDDGEPVWFLIAGAFPQPDESYAGDLVKLTGVPFNRTAGSAIESTTPLGRATLRFDGEDRLAFGYTVGALNQTKQLTRLPFGARRFACNGSPFPSRAAADNYSDVWTGTASNAGWGMTLFHVDDQLFAGWYTYDADREPTFFIVATTRQADGSYAGNVFRPRAGTPYAQIDDAAASPGSDPIGTATFRFENGERGTYSYSIDGQSRSEAIVRLLIGNSASMCRSADHEG